MVAVVAGVVVVPESLVGAVGSVCMLESTKVTLGDALGEEDELSRLVWVPESAKVTPADASGGGGELGRLVWVDTSLVDDADPV